MRYHVQEPDEENQLYQARERNVNRRYRHYTVPNWARSAAYSLASAGVNYVGRNSLSYIGKRLRQVDLKRYFQTSKKQNTPSAAPPPLDSEPIMAGPKRSASYGGVWQGSFPGRVKRHKSSKLYKGYKETIMHADQHSMLNVNYFGVQSYPAHPVASGRLFVDFWISILRHFFKNNHPGRIEFETPDEAIDSLLSVPIAPTVTASDLNETIRIVYRNPGGSTRIEGTPRTLCSSAVPPTTTYTLRSLATELANEVNTQWNAGYEPQLLQVYSAVVASATYVATIGVMRLDQVILKGSVTNVIKLQNSTVADVGEAIGDADLTNNIQSNPLHGRIYYFNGLCPTLATGYDVSGTNGPDEWAAANLSVPNTGTANNIIAPTVACTGCWKTLPKQDYFKNCVGYKAVQLEPGVQRSLVVRFKFNGYMTSFLKKSRTAFTTPATSNDYGFGMGQTVLVALEKRIRYGSVPVNIDYQVDTHISTSMSLKRQAMTLSVTTNAA